MTTRRTPFARTWLTPWRLAAVAAVRLVRERGVMHVIRLGVAGLRTLGPWGIIRRAAGTARQMEDDARYQHWVTAHGLTDADRRRRVEAVARLAYRPRLSVLVPVFNTDPVWLIRMIESVREQTYPDWELCVCDDGSTRAETVTALDQFKSDPRVRVVRSEPNGSIAHASNAALARATGEFVGFLDHDDELAPEALAEIALRLDAEPTLDIVYTDEDKIDASGQRVQPHFKPDWSLELLRSCMYISHFTVMRRQLVLDVGGFRAEFAGSQDYDLMLRAIERTTRVAHVPQVLYGWRMAPLSAASSRLAKPWAVEAARRALEDHLRRLSEPRTTMRSALRTPQSAKPALPTGLSASVLPAGAAGHFRVRYAIRGTPLVSILIASADAAKETADGDPDALRTCLRAVIAKTATPNVEFVIAHSAPLSEDVIGALRAKRHRLVSIARGTSLTLAAALNRAAREAAGDHLLVIDPHVAPLDSAWLEALLEFSQQDAIGAVGPFLFNPDRTIESAGLVLGAGGVAASALQGEPSWTRGHLSNALDIRNCSAVSGACLMTRRAAFERAGGFDERFGPALFDVDYGLRLRRAGLRVVVTPYARLVHHDAMQGPRVASRDDVNALRAIWGRALDQDPYYNPHFDRHAATFRLPEIDADQSAVGATYRPRA